MPRSGSPHTACYAMTAPQNMMDQATAALIRVNSSERDQRSTGARRRKHLPKGHAGVNLGILAPGGFHRTASTTQRNPNVPARSLLGAISRYLPCSVNFFALGKYQ